MVAAFQVARVADGGGADLGFSTSTDGGKAWTFFWTGPHYAFCNGGPA